MKKRGKNNERRQFSRLMKLVFETLESGEWSICYKKMRTNAARVFLADYCIVLDPRNGVLSGLVHECIHILCSEKRIKVSGTKDDIDEKKEERKEEKLVKKLEKLCMKYITQSQAVRLTKLLADNLVYTKKFPR